LPLAKPCGSRRISHTARRGQPNRPANDEKRPKAKWSGPRARFGPCPVFLSQPFPIVYLPTADRNRHRFPTIPRFSAAASRTTRSVLLRSIHAVRAPSPASCFLVANAGRVMSVAGCQERKLGRCSNHEWTRSGAKGGVSDREPLGTDTNVKKREPSRMHIKAEIIERAKP